MSKLNKITISVIAALSFNAYANTEKVEPENNQQIEVLQPVNELTISSLENIQSSSEKSDFRNKKGNIQIQNEYFDQLIASKVKQQELRRLDFILSLPVESTIDVSKYNLEPKEPARRGFDIKEDSLSLKSFAPQTFEIDQLIFREREKPKPVVQPNLNINVNNQNQGFDLGVVDSYIQNPLTIVRPSDSLFENKVIDILQPEPPKKQEVVSGGLTDAELAALGISREQYETWVSPKQETAANTPSEVINLDKVSQVNEFMEIKQVKIDKTFIFGDTKIIDLTMNLYVGDGIAGDTTTRAFKDIKEGAVIVFKDYRMRINNINATEVEIENLSSGKIYVASNF